VGNVGPGGGESNIHLGIGLDEGLIPQTLSSKAAANIVLQHLTNNRGRSKHSRGATDERQIGTATAMRPAERPLILFF